MSTTYNTNQFRAGLKVTLDNDPCVVTEAEFVKPGKGQAFTRVKLRNLKTNRVLERTFKSGETIEGADIVETAMQYLYKDGEYWHFMDPKSYEQHQASAESVGDASLWLKENAECVVTLHDNIVLQVTPPMFVELEVIETEPGIRGDTAGTGGKTAKLETGAVVRVPLFIEVGEKLKLDTRTGEYVGRVK